MPVHIYALIDPRDNTVRYVGKTVQPLPLRLKQHLWNARTAHTNHTAAGWMREVLQWGLRPAISLLEDVPQERWREAEREWGSKFAALSNDRARLGCGSTRAYVARWTPELEARLGVDTDESIAADMGITRKAVSYRRSILGIPANPSNGGTAQATGYRHNRKTGPLKGSHQSEQAKANRVLAATCAHGHPYVGHNVIHKKRGRDCRSCDLNRKRRTYYQRKETGPVDSD